MESLQPRCHDAATHKGVGKTGGLTLSSPKAPDSRDHESTASVYDETSRRPQTPIFDLKLN